METEQSLRLCDVFVSIHDPRQPGKVKHDFVELLVVAVNGVLVGADSFEEIELWANEKLDWLRSYLRLQNGIPSHDTFGRVFGLIDPGQFEQAFRRWMRGVLPALSDEVVAIDGKTSRRSGGIDPPRCIWFRPLPPARGWCWASAGRRKNPTRRPPFRSYFPHWPWKVQR
jgi:hypothetical protein